MKRQIASVSSHFQTLRRELKIRRAADFDKLQGIFYMSKTRASVSSRVSDTEEWMRARGRRPSAFICFEVSGTVIKHEQDEARVFDMSSQMKQ